VAKGLLILLAVFAGREVYRHHQAQQLLDEAVAELDRTDPGWRLLDVTAARAVVPDAENSALFVHRAGYLLPLYWPPPEVSEALQSVEGPDRLSGELAAQLRDCLESAGAARAEALKLADRPVGRYPLIYARIITETPLTGQSMVPKVMHLLSQEAFLCADAGNLSGAVRACRAALNAGRSLGDEPFAVSQSRLRYQAVVRTCRLVEWLLSQGEVRPRDLAVLQDALADEAKHPDLQIAYRGERAGLHELFVDVEKGEIAVSELSGAAPAWQEELLGWHLRDKIRAAHPVFLDFMTRVLATAQLPPQEQEAAEQVLAAAIRTQVREKNGALLHLVPAFPKIGSASRHKLAWLRSLVVALAAERYRHAHGAWPATLALLTPEYLSEVPADPYDGLPLRYRRQDDHVVIYSVGPDRQDDGGNLDRTADPGPGADVGCRLWDVAQRHRTPRHAPAPPAD
jgi:hypothetical protein